MNRYFRDRPGRALLAATAAVTAAVTAGCAGTPHPLASPQPTSRPTAAPGAQAVPHPAPPTITIVTGPARRARTSAPAATASPSATAPAGGAAPPPAQGPVTVPPCATADLDASVGSQVGTAGSVYYPLQFTNASGTTCSLFGYPGVAFVSAIGGGRIGAAAARNPAFPPQLVNLAPGAVVHADLQVATARLYPTPECKPVTAHWLQVYPPGEFTPLYVSFTTSTCSGPVPGGSALAVDVVRMGPFGL